MRYLATAAGLMAFAGSVLANPEIPKYSEKDLVYTRGSPVVKQGNFLVRDIRQFYDRDKRDPDPFDWDLSVHVRICMRDQEKMKYILGIYDDVAKRLFVLDINENVEKVVEGEKEIDAYDRPSLPDCSNLQKT